MEQFLMHLFMCLTLLSTCAEGVQFYCPSHTYTAIPYCTFFLLLEHYVIMSCKDKGNFKCINKYMKNVNKYQIFLQY